jgi:glycosyltransferase involved in cell wall biosynthesis
MPEIIEPGVNGFLVSNRNEAVDAVESAHRLDRSGVRRSIEGRFDASRMVDDYLSLYHRLLDR